MQRLSYEPTTGIFYWAQDVGVWGRIKKGTPAGYTRCDGRVVIRLDNVLRYAHHLVFESEGGIPAGYEVDHIDCNPNNNKRDNLRLVTSSQNSYNIRISSKNKSGVKGVHWNKATNSYRVRFRVDSKFKHFGMFKTIEEAESVAMHNREIHHGIHARHK